MEHKSHRGLTFRKLLRTTVQYHSSLKKCIPHWNKVFPMFLLSLLMILSSAPVVLKKCSFMENHRLSLMKGSSEAIHSPLLYRQGNRVQEFTQQSLGFLFCSVGGRVHVFFFFPRTQFMGTYLLHGYSVCANRIHSLPCAPRSWQARQQYLVGRHGGFDNTEALTL